MRIEKTFVVCAALYFLTPLQGAILVALGPVREAFPEVPSAAIGLIVSMSAIGQIIASIVSGMVTGRLLKYRTTALIALSLLVISGVLPAVLPASSGFVTILISRFFVGLAIGSFAPLPNAIIARSYANEQTRATVLGYGNAVFNIGAVVLQVITGYLTYISWQSAFLIHLAGILGLVLVAIFLKEPPSITELARDSQRKDGRMQAFLWLGSFSVLLMVSYPLMMYLSQAFAQSGVGNPASAGLVLSMHTAAGVVVAVSFGKVFARLGRWFMPLSVLVLAVGAGFCFFASGSQMGSVLLCFPSYFLVGLGLGGITIGTPFIVSTVVSPSAFTAAMGFFTAFMNIGTFLAAPYATLAMNITHAEEIRVVFLVSAGILLLASLVLALVMRCIKRFSSDCVKE